ncbi:hypothetical protein FQZ97_790270 [compost metagenome]
MVKVDRLPSVQVHGARAHAATGPGQAAAHRGVEVGGQAVQALRGATGEQRGRLQRFARGQAHFARRQPLAHLPLVLAVVQPFNGLAVVARPSQVRAIHGARVRSGPRYGDHRPGKAVVRGAAAPVLALPQAAREGIHLQLKLIGPLARERAHALRISRQRHGARSQPVHVQHVGTVIEQLAAQLQHVVSVQRQVQHQAQLGHAVRQVDGDALAGLQGVDAATVELLRKLLPAAVCQQRALAVPAHAKGGRHGQGLVELHAAGRDGPAIPQRRQRHAVVRQARAPIAPQRCLVRAHLQHHTAVGAVQNGECGRGLGHVGGHVQLQ